MDKEELWEWLGPLARRWGLERELGEQAPVFLWPKAVGKQLARLARPLYVEAGVLHVAVPGSVVAAELRLLQEGILDRLTQAGGKKLVGLRFHVRAVPAKAWAVEAVEPSPEEVAKAKAEVSRDLPPELRRRLVRIAAQAYARDRAILAAGGRRCPCCGVAFLGEGQRCPLCSLVSPREGG